MPCKCSCDCFKRTDFFVFCSHFLSAWGDRMWSFGVGIFLIHLSPESLQLTAIYGLCMGVSVLLFGAFIGDIVDNTPRLRAAQVALVLQNTFVVTNALLIYMYLMYKDDIVSWGGWSRHVFFALVIILGVLSRLTSIARSIAVEKDWIVEICKGDSDFLATMTATLRRIDLLMQVLAPVVTGLIMAYAGLEFGALFIGGWNLGSVVLEYYLLWKVYNTVPALRKKKDFVKAKASNDNKETVDENDEMNQGDANEQNEADMPLDMANGGSDKPETKPKKKGKMATRFSKLLVTVEKLYIGWPIYAQYKVAFAGLGLACLFMTVLGFDNITVGYAKMQGVSEGLLGVMQGLAALCGIFGTFMYPVMRRKLGLIRTGIFGLSFEVMCLLSCVLSIWMAGSPFDLSQGFEPDESGDSKGGNCTQNLNQTIPSNSSLSLSNSSVSTLSPTTGNCLVSEDDPSSYVSVWMLLAGIVTARFGLWLADLSITQLFMEEVKEEERGKVHGVQGSLNQLMNLLKYIMVVLAPYPHQFGVLILLSFAFICIGWLFYAHFLRKMRGHFLPHCWCPDKYKDTEEALSPTEATELNHTEAAEVNPTEATEFNPTEAVEVKA